ncbi:MAG: S9 family peptidase, partial [bacterium]|nr:S9 family peptidase [bacterium]
GSEPRELLVPDADRFADVDLGKVESWSFRTGDGTEILGRVHYPPDFDPEHKYPLLVYFYGGMSPIERSFGGRYPKNLWAAHGYVVYVLQPSGATGFGQEFSARHVNNWGKTVAEEIIEGTKQFAAAHPFVDAERIGCLGASYGGFMTMLLTTRTDLFAAAVSHAGISSISSYWGQGWWGYHYSATASAGSYPWNNRELYVDQSPLFHADKITTPLLLLHGDADTNVPPGESQQLYTALKVLGKEVELIEVGDENHRIQDYPKRKLWMQTILAWFDKQLKGQPEFWQYLYGAEAEPKG